MTRLMRGGAAASVAAVAVHHDDRDIVARAALERQREQVVANLLGIGRGQPVGDLVVAHVRDQPVAAQKKPVAGLDRSIDDLELGLIGDAERARDDVASRPRPGLRPW